MAPGRRERSARPIGQAVGSPADPPAQGADEATPRPLRILVVDDNAQAADSLIRVLRSWGHESLAAFDGASALDAAEAFHPGVVLLDIALPDMDGYAVARRLGSGPAGRPILVAMTGYEGDDDRRRAREAGFDGLLAKPLDLDALERLLADPASLRHALAGRTSPPA
jgi:two-component system CheB/CheR fusion protein